jgi:hypothetical protein
LEKINQITLYFVKEGPDCGSEDIKKQCNINCFDFLFSSVFFDERHGRKNHNQLKRTALK